jgi:PEGA domain-containing protein
MFKRLAIGFSVLLLAAGSFSAQERANVSNQRAILEQILAQTYQPSVVGKHLMGIGSETEVRRAGIIVVVQRPGLYAALNRSETASASIHGLEANVFRGNKDYAVPVGERFYVTAISVGGETVFFGLLSARLIALPQGSGRLWAVATFYLPPQVLANAEKDAVFRAVDNWFVPEGRTVTNGTAALTPAASTPPQPPPAATQQTLARDMTRDQVIAAMGLPQHAVTFEGRTWLSYPGMMVVLQGDKLVSVDQSGQSAAKIAIHSEPTGAEIYLDGQLIGSTPSTVDVPFGHHQISVRHSGFLDWQRDLRVLAGSELNLQAMLEKK